MLHLFLDIFGKVINLALIGSAEMLILPYKEFQIEFTSATKPDGIFQLID